ncbi:efflux RND transporter periplasmic adaptor subunit [Niveispirillum cyanobacteriorum]|uniref:Efflux RND transporter periplasmic adaptor subunit n=1 Tax=Niveispirillum cyanobacteriorum TaxID=1612173 RepID=A0A2K9N9L0_9PROT|nr:efflux RND transporter periplasmic adaptor subunit [Niveispirillum cyanobacteriorum]AUN29692.1 efflux RND transporter periplasmic adaptor subunit [Niveispirillum cyanobacteriorum]GGE61748.1 membrane protein [Niveispirillum cyanobacteriorum]
MRALLLPVLALTLLVPPVMAADGDFPVTVQKLPDEKSVYATVETVNAIPARVRTGGTITRLSVREGDAVTAGQAIASVGDQKLSLQQGALDAQIAAARAQMEQAQGDLERADALSRNGFVTRQRLDELRTAANVAANALKARMAERAVLGQQMNEGQVLAPATGRVLSVPVTPGTVVMPGETVAIIAERDYVLRLSVPERHAASLKAGDPVRLDPDDLTPGDEAGQGQVTLVYPRISDGRVQADARVMGLGDYFVGQRVRVWVPTGERPVIIVPAVYLTTRFGMDFAHLRQGAGVVEVPVRRGHARPRPGMPDGVEILSGLNNGDILVRP